LLERMKVKHLPHRLQQVSKYFCDKEREKKWYHSKLLLLGQLRWTYENAEILVSCNVFFFFYTHLFRNNNTAGNVSIIKQNTPFVNKKCYNFIKICMYLAMF
jgi:hypothetical protein